MGKIKKGFAPAAIVFIFLIIASILIALLLINEGVDEVRVGKVELKHAYEFQNASYALGKQGFLVYCNYYRPPLIHLNYTEVMGDSVNINGVWVKNRMFNITERVNNTLKEITTWNTTNIQEKVDWLNTHGEKCTLSTGPGGAEGCSGGVFFNITCTGNDVETSDGIKRLNISYYGYVSE